MNRVNHRQLEALRAVIATGTVTAAGDLLGVSQPAVSRYISDLEYGLQLKLFERNKGRLEPTAECLILFQEIERSFVGIERICRTAQELRQSAKGLLRIAAMPALALTVLPKLLHDFGQSHPGISISLQTRSSQKVAELVASGQADLGLGALPSADPMAVCRTLIRTDLVCVLPPGHRLSTARSVGPDDLSGDVFISLGTELSVGALVDQVFEGAAVSRNLAIDTQLSFTACSFVLAGSGVSVVDPVTASHFSRLGLHAVPFRPSIPFEFRTYLNPQRPTPLLVSEFLERLKPALNEDLATVGLTPAP